MAREKSKPQSVRDLLIEIATIAKDTTVSLYGGALSHQDETLLSRGGGEGLKVYDRIERDCHASAVLQKRKKAVSSRPWDVSAFSEAKQDQQAADLIRRCLTGFNFDLACENLLDAVLKGFAVGEVMWKKASDGVIHPYEIRARDQRRFTFVDNPAGPELRLLTRANLLTGEALPDRKFIVHSLGSKTGNPFGLGLGSILFWPVFFKRQGITFWLTFCDKYGSPTAVGKYPAGTEKKEQTKLLAALQAIAQNAGVIVPAGMEIALLEAARSGIDTYETLVRYMDEQISEAVLGETGSTNQSGDGGSRARDEVGNECRLEIARSDADLLSAVLNQTLVRWIIDVNMPGAGYPTVWRDYEEPEDLLTRSQRDRNLLEAKGFRFTRKYWLRTYGFEEDDIEDMPTPQPSPIGTGVLGRPMSFAEPGADLVERNLRQLEKEAQPAMDSMIDAVRTLLANSNSLEEARDRLVEVFAEADPTAIGTAVQRALVTAELGGRAEVVDGK